MTRYFKVHLLVNHQTLEEAADGFINRNIGMVQVKGKTQAVQIDEIAGRRGGAVDPAFYEEFANALVDAAEGIAGSGQTGSGGTGQAKA